MYEPPSDAPRTIAPTAPGRPGIPLEPSRLGSALSRGRRTILRGAVIAGVLGSTAAATVIPREYATEVVLLVAEEPSPASAAPGASGDAARHVRTVADSLKLPTTIERVKKRIGSQESLEALGKAIQIEASPNTNLVTVRVTRKSAVEAARLADAAGAEFVGVRTDEARKRLEEERRRLEEERDAAEKVLAEARGKREAFRKEHGLSDVPAEIRVALEQAARHAADSEISVASVEAEQARLALLRGAVAAEPRLTMIAEQQVTPEAMKLAEIKAQIAAESGRLDEQHPRLGALTAQAGALESMLRGPRDPLVASRTMTQNPRLETLKLEMQNAAGARAAAERRGIALATFSRVARERVAELAALQAPLAVLDSELGHAQGHVDDLDKRLAKVVEATRAPAADLSQLAPAVVPSRPLKPTRRIVGLASPVVGAAIGAILTLARALRGLRARSASEIAFWTRTPVLAAVRGASGEALAGLRADVGAHLARWDGATLVVILEEADRPFATTFASLVGPGDARVSLLDDATALDAFRRERRAADRVVVLVRSGRHAIGALGRASRVLTGDDGGPAAIVVFGLDPELVGCRDRLGELSAFFQVATPEGTRT